jgi:hypothetical protein
VIQAVPTVLVSGSELDISYLFAAPVKTELPNTMTSTSSTVYQSVPISWKKGGPTGPAHSGVFQAGTEYTAVMTLVAKSGYTFYGLPASGGPGSVYYSGASASHLAVTTTPGTSLYITITFPITAPASVSGTITDYWANSSNPPPLDATVELKDSGGTVISSTTSDTTDGTYSFTNVAGGSGYTIAVSKADYAPVSLASFNVAAVDVSGKNAVMRKQITDFDLSGIIAVPVAGMSAPTTAFTGTEYTGSVIWNPSANPCIDGTVYTATLTLNAASGYSFAGLGANAFSCTEANSAPGSVTSPAKNPGTGLVPDTGSTSIAVSITYPPAQTLTVPLNTSGYSNSLANTLDHIRTTIGAEYTNYEITVANSETITLRPLGADLLWATTFPKLKNVTITLKANSPVVISLTSNGSLFSLRGQNADGRVKLVLDQNITLKGKDGNNAPLVNVEYGDLVMNAGSAIINNKRSGGDGGGVYLTYSSFTMNGGTISDNKASSGGGVYITGTFTKDSSVGPSYIYGDTDNVHTAGEDENTATSSPSGAGHAVRHSDGKKRDFHAGPGDNMTTAGYGGAEGWD